MGADEQEKLLEAELAYERYILKVLQIIKKKLEIIIDYRKKLGEEKIRSISKMEEKK